MSSHEHEQLHQVAAYLLRALEEDEAADFRHHLDGCDVCRRELAELGPMVDLLPSAAPPRAAPPELGERLMAVVCSEAELLKAAGAGADRAPAPSRPRWRLRPLAGLAAAATLAVGIAVGLALGGGGGGVHQTRATVAAAGASAVLRQVGNRAELVVSGMPAPPSGRIYQLWVKRPGRAPTPTDVLFGVNHAGAAAVDVPGSLRGVSRLMVTSEPQGGSLVPTSAPVLTVAPVRS